MVYTAERLCGLVWPARQADTDMADMAANAGRLPGAATLAGVLRKSGHGPLRLPGEAARGVSPGTQETVSECVTTLKTH